jgi:predicted metal-dependent phosphoesterase TrpH
MHLHTVHSDSPRLPAELVAAAGAAGLDFIVSTEHNTSSASGHWGAHATEDLLIVDGEEITTRNGHFLAIGLPSGRWIDWRYRAVDGVIGQIVRQIHRTGALAVAAHPFCPFLGCSWKFGYEDFDAVEVWNGPWSQDDEAAVAVWDSLLVAQRRERWLPAVGNSDAHGAPQVVGLPHNVVLAADLTRRAILDGIRSGRLWLAESSAVDLTFTASAAGRTATIGERLPAGPAHRVDLRLEVSGAPGCAVRLVTDQGQAVLAALPASGSGTVTWTTTPTASAYVRAEVRRPVPGAGGTMVALTNPIFLGTVSR